MEAGQNAFVESQRKKKRKKRIRNIIILCVAALILAVGGVALFGALNGGDESYSQLSYSASRVNEGEISSTISGSGTLSATDSDSMTSGAAATVTAVYYQPGDTVPAGETILTLSSDELEEQLDALYDELDAVYAELADETQERTNLNVTASKAGVVKDVRAAEGDTAEELAYLCLISTDGRMKLVIDAPEGLRKYDGVLVSVEGAEAVEGSVKALEDGRATIVFEDDGYAVGAAAVVSDEDGAELGAGTVEVNEHVRVTAEAGRVASLVNAVENRAVSRGATLFKLEEGAPSGDYLSLKREESDLLEQIEALEEQLAISVDYDCLVASLPVQAGDELAAGATLCVLSGSAGYTMTLSIDELDIASVALGQEATVTLDALEGEYAGRVTDISYAGSGSYVTSYTVTVTTDPIEGALPGMSASVEIVTETSGQSLIVSVGAVQYEGDSAFVYLCGDDVRLGATLGEDELDLDTLTKLYVETGMSDGSYIAITAEGLSAGDLIWMPERTTTAVYTEDEDAAASFSFGGMNGGMGGMGGEMPTGGGNMGSGMGGGERPSGGFPGGN
ncbi:MAG: HlyD family efflux transporter periplasmic adaptor subunit [Clostridia bacterium]|nr:HlyD family efflux transporter periplasmic adaptor subunit [Clostridia bacterium]